MGKDWNWNVGGVLGYNKNKVTYVNVKAPAIFLQFDYPAAYPAEIAKTEAENLEIVKIIRAMDMSIPELEAFKKRMKNELPGRIEIQKEETRSDDEFREDETEEI